MQNDGFARADDNAALIVVYANRIRRRSKRYASEIFLCFFLIDATKPRAPVAHAAVQPVHCGLVRLGFWTGLTSTFAGQPTGKVIEFHKSAASSLGLENQIACRSA